MRYSVRDLVFGVFWCDFQPSSTTEKIFTLQNNKVAIFELSSFRPRYNIRRNKHRGRCLFTAFTTCALGSYNLSAWEESSPSSFYDNCYRPPGDNLSLYIFPPGGFTFLLGASFFSEPNDLCRSSPFLPNKETFWGRYLTRR